MLFYCKRGERKLNLKSQILDCMTFVLNVWAATVLEENITLILNQYHLPKNVAVDFIFHHIAVNSGCPAVIIKL